MPNCNLFKLPAPGEAGNAGSGQENTSPDKVSRLSFGFKSDVVDIIKGANSARVYHGLAVIRLGIGVLRVWFLLEESNA